MTSGSRRFPKISVFFLIGLLAICCFAARLTSGDVAPRINLRDVNVGGEIGRRIDITVNKNLLKIKVDRDFLTPFRENSGGAYIGLGKLIDSTVRFAAHTGEKEVVRLKKHLVKETIETQEDDGYIGIKPPGQRMWTLWDMHEMAYIVVGLTSDYKFFGNERSLKAASDLMDYLIRRWSAEPDRFNPHITTFMAVTGLEEALLMLHDATGEQRYLDFCVDFRELPEWDIPIVLGRWGPITGHAYAYLHRCLAQLRLHQIQADDRLLTQTHGVMGFLRKGDGLLINGVVSKHECWTNNQDGSEGLGETCATAYLIRVYDELLRMKRNSLYGDMMERSIYNGLFAAQSPDGRRLRYYVPFEGPRKYFDKDTYCCPNNYRRIIAELPSMVYYRFGAGLAVNLYAPSRAELRLTNGPAVEVRQETDYPNSGHVKITMKPSESAEFPVFLRIPRWCSEAKIQVNGHGTASRVAGGQFHRLQRKWEKGDIIELQMPMELRLVKGRKAQAGQVAVMRGPQLFCLNPDRNPALKGADLEELHIDPASLKGPEPDDSVRPGGQAVRARAARSMPFAPGVNYSLDLVLTEFPDPGGRATYFRVLRMGRVGVEDELISTQ